MEIGLSMLNIDTARDPTWITPPPVIAMAITTTSTASQRAATTRRRPRCQFGRATPGGMLSVRLR